MSKVVADGAKPDLEFYYDITLRKKTVTFSNEDLDTYISQNTIFLDKELTIPIGNFIFTLEYCKDIKIFTANFYFSFVNYKDLKGGFETSVITKEGIKPGVINLNSYLVYNIFSGSGSFLEVSGFTVILKDSTPIRHVLVYFAK
jgi:hypothetical protein